MSESASAEKASAYRQIAKRARAASLQFQLESAATRNHALSTFSSLLSAQAAQLAAANHKDIEAFSASGASTSVLLARLKFDEKKIETLKQGFQTLIDMEDPIGRTLLHREITSGLELRKVSCPLGVLLIIFESRPDVLPQLFGLAVKTGNSLILKGGKESVETLRALHKLCCEAILTATEGRVKGEDLISLVEDRDAILPLLELKGFIDLVIPRGSNQLVQYIEAHTKIPVMGHSEGVCHCYLDYPAADEAGAVSPAAASALLQKGTTIILDSKCDYPAACNAAETFLVHSKWAARPAEGELSPLETVLLALSAARVKLFAGPKLTTLLPLSSSLPALTPTVELHHEYGDLALTVELVDDVEHAIEHINKYSSSHTDTIVTDSSEHAKLFEQKVDSACVYVNTSTRFSDGFRFGFGAEVGISTGRLHARGPVGVDGMLTYKYLMNSDSLNGHTVGQQAAGKWKYTHKELPL